MSTTQGTSAKGETVTETTSAGGETVTETTTEGTQGEPADQPLGVAGKRALKAEREARAAAEKATAALQARLAEIETAKMTDLDRAKTAAKDAEAAAAKATTEALRWRVAAKHGVTDDDAELFLTGSDEDTLTRQAERLAARTTESQTAAPRADLTQGSSHGTSSTAGSPAADFAHFLSGQLKR
jgi:hypothetical protein